MRRTFASLLGQHVAAVGLVVFMSGRMELKTRPTKNRGVQRQGPCRMNKADMRMRTSTPMQRQINCRELGSHEGFNVAQSIIE